MMASLEDRMLRSVEMVLAVAERRVESGELEVTSEVSKAVDSLRTAIDQARATRTPNAVRVMKALSAAARVSRLASPSTAKAFPTHKAAA